MTAADNRVFRVLQSFALGAALLGAGACIGPFESCDAVGKYGIEITVLDSLSGKSPVGAAVLTVRDGDFQESSGAALLVSGGTLIIAGALDRPGTYDVVLRMAPYQDWTKNAVRVTASGRCDEVDTVKLTARLVGIT